MVHRVVLHAFGAEINRFAVDDRLPLFPLRGRLFYDDGSFLFLFLGRTFSAFRFFFSTAAIATTTTTS